MTRWRITFRPAGDGPPMAIRVRRLLKAALRHFGLRCIDVAELPAAAPGCDSGATLTTDPTEGPILPATAPQREPAAWGDGLADMAKAMRIEQTPAADAAEYQPPGDRQGTYRERYSQRIS